MRELVSGCKINLYLRITGRMPNGYHTLESLFFPLPLPCDRILAEIRPDRPGCFELRCGALGIDPADNTLAKAYRVYGDALRGKGRSFELPGLEVELVKGVPHGAGLGGGSADAARLLHLLQELAGSEGLEEGELNAVAARVGADVPFFLLNVPALASGIGEKLAPVANPLPGRHLLLACPDVRVNTAWAYAEWDKRQAEAGSGPENSRLTSSSAQAKNPLSGGLQFFNSFEPVVFAAYPELARIKSLILEARAEGALMSGSGSSLFGVFKERSAAERLGSVLERQGLTVYVQALDAGVSPSWQGI